MSSTEKIAITLDDLWNDYQKKDKYKDYNIAQAVHESLIINNVYTNQFDWEKYLQTYSDIIDENTELACYKHWIQNGIVENRCAGIKNSQAPYERFEWESYMRLNPDLSQIHSELELYHHWISNGIYENRMVTEIETITKPSNTVQEIDPKTEVDFFEDSKMNQQWVILLNNYLDELEWKDYLTKYDDLVKGGVQTNYDATIHWIFHGRNEGRTGQTLKLKKHKKTNTKRSEKKDLFINNESKNYHLEHIPIYIINLPDRIDKKIEMEYQLQNSNINNAIFYNAIGKEDIVVQEKYKEYNEKFKSKEIKTSFYRSIEEKKIITSIGAVGLITTTIELFKELENKNASDVIIMEDDIHFHHAWKYMIKPLKSCLDDVDLLYLGYNNYLPDINQFLKRDNLNITVPIPYNRSWGAFYGTYGYICNSHFRKRIIELGIDWFIENNATLDYGYNILNWEREIDVHTITGDQLIYPDIDDPESIHKIRKDAEEFYRIREIKCNDYIHNITCNLSFVFIIPSYNNEHIIEKNLQLIFDQTYTNWKIIYINDCSTDKTHEKFEELTENYKDKIMYINNKEKLGQGFNRYRAYNMCHDNDFCVLLDGDDWLANNYVLKYLTTFIPYHNVEMTYGNFKYFENNVVDDELRCPGDYSEEIRKNKSYRKDKWRAMHLRVMKASLLKQVCVLDYMDSKFDFNPCATDLVESYACLELSEGKHKHVPECLLIYNKSNSELYNTSYYNNEKNETEWKKRKNIVKRINNIPPYQTKIKSQNIVVIDIEKSGYKNMLKKYKNELSSKMDLFLVKGSEIHLYVEKLNAYKEIIYLT